MAEPYTREMIEAETPGPMADERQMLEFLDGLEAESKAVEKMVQGSWDTNLSWFRGQQWRVRNRAPMFMANKIHEIIRKKVAKLTEMKPQMMLQSRREGYDTTASVLQEAIEAGWDEYSMQMVLHDLALHMSLYGAGFLHLPYDRGADYGQGDIVPGVFDPQSVHFDPAVKRAQDLWDASYLWTSSTLPTWQIRQMWPGRGMLVGAGSAGPDEKSISARIRRLFGVSKSGSEPIPEAIPRSEIREYWFRDPTVGKDGQLVYPTGRRVVRGGSDIILEDGPNPYYDGRWPFVMIDGMPDPENPWGTSDVNGLRRLQDSVNRIGHMFVENSLLTGNTWITVDQQALTPTTLQRLNNIGAIIIEKQAGRAVERESPPPMPAHMMGFVELAMTLMDQLAGLTDTTISSQGRAEVRSDQQLEGLQQAAETLIRATARRLESGLERFGQLWISRIFQFYTRDRTLAFMGPTLEWQTFEFERAKLLQDIQKATMADIDRRIRTQTMEKSGDQMHRDALRRAWQHFAFKITPGSSLSSVRAARAALHANLAREGMISRVTVLKQLGIENPEAEIDKALQEAAMLGGGGGGQQTGSPAMRKAM